MARVAAGLVEHLPGADIGLLLLDDRERAYLVPEQITVFTANCDGSLIRSVRAVYRHLSLWRPTVALSRPLIRFCILEVENAAQNETARRTKVLTPIAVKRGIHQNLADRVRRENLHRFHKLTDSPVNRAGIHKNRAT